MPSLAWIKEAAGHGDIVHLAQHRELVLVHQPQKCAGGCGQVVRHGACKPMQSDPKRVELLVVCWMWIQVRERLLDRVVQLPRGREEVGECVEGV